MRSGPHTETTLSGVSRHASSTPFASSFLMSSVAPLSSSHSVERGFMRAKTSIDVAFIRSIVGKMTTLSFALVTFTSGWLR